MNKPSTDSSLDEKSFRNPPKGPSLILVLGTVLVLLSYPLAWLFRTALSDNLLQFDFGLVNFLFAGFLLLFGIWWLVWLVFQSNLSMLWSRVLPFVVITAGVTFLVLYVPRFDGAMGFQRWEPRFGGVRELELKPVEQNNIDLAQSPYDFAQFWGPHRNGIVDQFAVPLVDLTQQASLVWKQPIGEGWSGFAIRNGTAITMQQNGDDELVCSYELKTGKLLWTYQSPGRFDDFAGGVGPRSTPTIHQGRVYALGAFGQFVCLDASNGNLIWKQDLPELLGISVEEQPGSLGGVPIRREVSSVMWGRSASPLIYKDMVIVTGGGPVDGPYASLMAFHADTGKLLWKGGTDDIGYGSPLLAELAKREQIVIINENTVSAHDPLTGNVLWSHPWPGNSDGDANTSQVTIVDESHVLVSKGYGVGAELLEIRRAEGDKLSVHSVWKRANVLKTKLTSPIIRDGYAYALSDGILECVDVQTGDRIWKKGRYQHGQLLLLGDKLLVHAENGFLALVDATPDGFQEHGRFSTIDGICWNTIAVYERYVLVRSELEAACIEIEELTP